MTKFNKTAYLLIIFTLLLSTLAINVNIAKAEDIAQRLSGRILLQVEQKGEAWYVNPVDLKRYYLGTPDAAYQIMRKLGLGVSNKDYYSWNGYAPARLSGRILLQVEERGEAYYINPLDLKMHYLGMPLDAFNIMSALGLGITDADLNNIEIGSGKTIVKTDNPLNQYLAAQNKIQKFADAQDFKTFIENNPQTGSIGFDYFMPEEEMERGVAESVSPTLSEDKAGESTDFSQTNIQIEGVDEADIIKTDGKYVYALSNNLVYIIDAYPADTSEIIAKISLESNYSPENIYLNNGKLIIFGQIYNMPDEDKVIYHRNSFTFVKIFDVNNAKSPVLAGEYKFEGDYSNSRMIGDYMYLITTNWNYNIENDKILPQILKDDEEISCMDAVGCVMPDIYRFDIPYPAYNLTNIHSINVQDPDQILQTDMYLMSANQNMYVSQNNIYITYTKQLSWPIFEEFNETMDEQIIIDELEKTVIHKIAIDNGKIDYKTFGEVNGSVLNQFSMDEDNGYFRIATTKNNFWGFNELYNNLYVLDSNLNLAGQIENLAPGEKIYSVRFMQDKAYMVTFQQIDPLFVIDLKDPRNPKILGELKIPGYSTYLHPYDENTIIGLGRDTEIAEWGGVINGGIKLSLFDVSEFSQPREIDSYIFGDSGTDSVALYDHKAFLFNKEKNMLVIPIAEYSHFIFEADPMPMSAVGIVKEQPFNGAAVFHIDKNGLNLRAKISHPASGYDYKYNSNVKRSLYIENVLYTFSDKYLKSNYISNLVTVKDLELK